MFIYLKQPTINLVLAGTIQCHLATMRLDSNYLCLSHTLEKSTKIMTLENKVFMLSKLLWSSSSQHSHDNSRFISGVRIVPKSLKRQIQSYL